MQKAVAKRKEAKAFFSIVNKTKKEVPLIPFEKISKDILGKKYELSLVIAGDTLTKRLNLTFRDKNKPANVLSFPLSKDSGEIFLNLSRAKKECKKFEMSEKGFVGFLLIHGMLHLKGFEHGSRMEGAEKRFCKKYGFK